MITYPAGEICPHGAYEFVRTRLPQFSYHRANDPTKPADEALNFHIFGGKAPRRFLHDNGIIVRKGGIKGLLAPWNIQQQQGATQDGATVNGAVYDPAEPELPLLSFGRTPQLHAKVVRDWIEAWDARVQGEFSITSDAGYFYAPVRWNKVPVDQFRLGGYVQNLNWSIQIDDAFWRGIDSTCEFFPGVGTASSFMKVTNSGDQDMYVNHVFHGPGTVEIANGPGSTSMVKFGPLLANQVALLRTEPRRRGVYDLTPAGANVPQQQLNDWQKFIKALTTFATNNNVGGLLRWFESLFGILPPQGEFYTLLNGRFTRPVPAKPIGGNPVESNIAVKFTGATNQTKLITYGTPLRRWPL